MLIKIKGEKLKQLRGGRSLDAIAKESNGAFSDVALMKWESGKMQPKEKNIKVLLNLYGVRLEDIAEPMEIAA
jgi:transcriptional regulator with XRE-family HTH domain